MAIDYTQSIPNNVDLPNPNEGLPNRLVRPILDPNKVADANRQAHPSKLAHPSMADHRNK